MTSTEQTGMKIDVAIKPEFIVFFFVFCRRFFFIFRLYGGLTGGRGCHRAVSV